MATTYTRTSRVHQHVHCRAIDVANGLIDNGCTVHLPTHTHTHTHTSCRDCDHHNFNCVVGQVATIHRDALFYHHPRALLRRVKQHAHGIIATPVISVAPRSSTHVSMHTCTQQFSPRSDVVFSDALVITQVGGWGKITHAQKSLATSGTSATTKMATSELCLPGAHGAVAVASIMHALGSLNSRRFEKPQCKGPCARAKNVFKKVKMLLSNYTQTQA